MFGAKPAEEKKDDAGKTPAPAQVSIFSEAR